MSPTVFVVRGYRFLFFSREEPRMHVHVQASHGEAKFWLEPRIELAKSQGLSPRQLRFLCTTVEERSDDIHRAWHRHFSG